VTLFILGLGIGLTLVGFIELAFKQKSWSLYLAVGVTLMLIGLVMI